MSATMTMRIGDTEIPLDGVTWEQMSVQGEDPHERPLSVMTLSCELTASAEKDWKRAWDEMRKETAPRYALTFTRKLRDGSTITEEIEVDRIDVVLARRGLKRPGQWTDATRARRHKRLVRAAQRRAREWSVRAWHRFNASSGRRGRREQERLLDDRFAGEEPSS